MPSGVQGAQSFSRSMNILQLISDASVPMSRAELLKQCGLTRPTLYRIIASLEAEGLIEAVGDNRYALGARLVSLARSALAQTDVRRVAEPILAGLRDQTGETVHLAVRSGDELVYIDKMESREAVRMASTIGTRVPFHSSSVGKAFLAAMPMAEADELIDRLEMAPVTSHTNTDRAKLRKTVQQARDQGYIRDDEENELSIICFGAPIYRGRDKPAASVSVSVPLYRLGDEARYSGPLRTAVEEISRKMGYDRNG